MSNIPPVFFAECLADLERDMAKKKGKGTPESLVVSLAAKTPKTNVCSNVFHMRLLECELVGQFNLNDTRYRPIRSPGLPVAIGESKGYVFVATEEEEAVQRWPAGDF